MNFINKYFIKKFDKYKTMQAIIKNANTQQSANKQPEINKIN